MAVPPEPRIHAVNIEGQNYGAIANSSAGRSALEYLIEFNKTSNGAFRILQLIDKVSKAVSMLLKQLGHTLSSFFEDFSGKVGSALAVFAIPRLPAVTKDAWEAITSWGTVEGPRGYPLRGHIQRVHNMADCVASWGYAASLVFNSAPLKNMADVPSFVSDLTDMTMVAEDYRMASRHLEQLPAGETDLKERFEGTQRDAMLKLIKTIASVVSGALGLIVLVLGGPIVPAAALLALSLTSTFFALVAHFDSATRTYEVVKFFEWRKNPLFIEVGGQQQLIN